MNKVKLGNYLDIITPIFEPSRKMSQEKFRELYSPKRSELSHGEFDLWPVTNKTPIIVKRATETLAWYFKRELRFDFAGYSANETNDPRDRIYLITHSETYVDYAAIGAIVFRWRDYRNAPPERVLAWVWIHPYFRNKNVLTSYWPLFRKLYGDFYVEPPLSSAMREFLKKMNHPLPNSR